MGDARRHLAERGHLGGLDQLALGLPQVALGTGPLLDLPREPEIGRAQVGGAGRDLGLQLALRRAVLAHPPQVLAAVEADQAEHDQRQDRADAGAAPGDGHRRGVGEEQQRPAIGRHRFLLEQGAAARHHLGMLDQGRAADRLRPAEIDRRVGLAPVLTRARHLRAGGLVEGFRRVELEGGVGGEEDDAVLVGDQHAVGALAPDRLQRIEADLGRHHAAHRAVDDDGGADEVAGHPGHGADGVEPPGAPRPRFGEVGPVGEILADIALGRFPVRGGDGQARGDQQVDDAAPRIAAQPLEVGVDGGDLRRVVGRGQHLPDPGVEGGRRRQEAEALDRALQGLRVDLRPLAGVGGEARGHPVLGHVARLDHDEESRDREGGEEQDAHGLGARERDHSHGSDGALRRRRNEWRAGSEPNMSASRSGLLRLPARNDGKATHAPSLRGKAEAIQRHAGGRSRAAAWKAAAARLNPSSAPSSPPLRSGAARR
ncbi:hypothetical protein CHKEEEPN_0302 [Methylorubrum podarium]|nr:hypothetical protein CHKEEEPN_0302 [Methylorubrum podarium]